MVEKGVRRGICHAIHRYANANNKTEVDVLSWKTTWTSQYSLFLSERMKIKKVGKVVGILHDKTEYIIHIRNLKQTLNHGLGLEKVCRVIKFNHKSWLKPYIDMNKKLKQKAKTNFERDFFKLMNYVVFGKTIENVRKHRNVKLVTTDRRENYLVSEPNYHITKFFTENLLA